MAREVTGIMGLGKEITYDTAVSPTHIFHASDARHGSRVDKFDEAETANGYNFSTGITPTADMTRLNINTVAHDEALAALASAAMGSDTKSTPSGGTAARQHKIVPLAVSADLGSYTVQASVTTVSETTVRKATRYSGALCDSFTLSSDVRGKVARIQTEWAVSGTRAAGVDLTSASRPNFGPFIHNNVFLAIGSAFVPASLELPTYASAADSPTFAEITGATAGATGDWSKYVRGFSFSYRNNIDQEGGHSGSTGLNATSMYIGRPEMMLSLTLRFAEGDTDMVALIDGDGTWTKSLGLYCWSPTKIEDVTTDYQYGYSLFIPKVIQDSEPQWSSQNLGIREFTVSFKVVENQTQNAAELYVWNKDDTDWA